MRYSVVETDVELVFLKYFVSWVRGDRVRGDVWRSDIGVLSYYFNIYHLSGSVIGTVSEYREFLILDILS